MTVDDAEPKPLRYVVDVSKLLEHTGTSLTVEDTLDIGPLEVGGERFEPVRPSSFRMDVVNSGSGVVATGTITGAYTAECSRCLETFELALNGTIERFFVDPASVDTVPEEQDYEPITHGRVDVADALLEALTMELPFAPVHDEGCKGICPTCGVDLTTSTCACPTAPVASPFGALAGLLDASEDSSKDPSED